MNIALAIGRMLGGGSRFGRRFGECCLGCCLDRPTQRWIEDVGGWAEGEGVWDTNGEMEEHLFFYRAGRFVKAG